MKKQLLLVFVVCLLASFLIGIVSYASDDACVPCEPDVIDTMYHTVHSV